MDYARTRDTAVRHGDGAERPRFTARVRRHRRAAPIPCRPHLPSMPENAAQEKRAKDCAPTRRTVVRSGVIADLVKPTVSPQTLETALISTEHAVRDRPATANASITPHAAPAGDSAVRATSSAQERTTTSRTPQKARRSSHHCPQLSSRSSDFGVASWSRTRGAIANRNAPITCSARRGRSAGESSSITVTPLMREHTPSVPILLKRIQIAGADSTRCRPEATADRSVTLMTIA